MNGHPPERFVVIADSREQAPYAFPCGSVRKALAAGDYSVDGLEDRIAVERKSLSDFVHTVIHDFDRFRRELQLLSAYEAACIVVEADMDAVLRNDRTYDLRAASPESVLGASLHIMLEFHIPVIWCGTRQAARAFTEMYLRMAARKAANSQR